MSGFVVFLPCLHFAWPHCGYFLHRGYSALQVVSGSRYFLLCWHLHGCLYLTHICFLRVTSAEFTSYTSACIWDICRRCLETKQDLTGEGELYTPEPGGFIRGLPEVVVLCPANVKSPLCTSVKQDCTMNIFCCQPGLYLLIFGALEETIVRLPSLPSPQHTQITNYLLDGQLTHIWYSYIQNVGHLSNSNQSGIFWFIVFILHLTNQAWAITDLFPLVYRSQTIILFGQSLDWTHLVLLVGVMGWIITPGWCSS